ncbi:ABC transporter ATP-binding protein [Eubacterium sp. AM46-8]|uniref:ABC transporter ATP-binding protein n=1 Tax=Eubacterium sp. AM46-8 TaxID=2292350 RepID=UPI000E538908|nr:ABC transporter ATP-binding protein [Eubacterium sp. AM46-8]RGZ90158.1 ABC transporter ATP-binding protein [Eubacterium sp. AM46-8]
MDKEQKLQLKKIVKNPAMSWIFGVSGKLKLGVLLLVLLNSAISISAVAFALVLREAIDGAVSGNKMVFLKFVIILGLIMVGQIAARGVIRFLDEYVRSGMENVIKTRLYETILSRKYSAITAYHTGELLNRITNDAVVVADGFVQIIPGIIAMLVKLAGAAAVLFVLDYRFSVIFFAGGGLVLIFTTLFRRVMKKLHKDVQAADGVLRSYLSENLGSLMVLKTFGAERKSIDTSKQYMDKHRFMRMKRNKFSNICNVGFGLVMNGGYIFGLCWCSFGILHGSITYGTLSAVLQLVDQLWAPLANMTGYLPKFYGMLSSAERCMELETLEEEHVESQFSRDYCRELYKDMTAIECKNITFRYEDDIILENADISIGKGELITIMGNSGAGKSTLLKLLLAIYEPEKGTLEIKTEKESYALTEKYRKMFAYVPQGNFLMSGNVTSAIASLDDTSADVDMDKVKAVAHIACADTFVEKLEHGYDTLIGERGMGISEGQAQRLAIARALYTDAPVLLLDEATSALDEQIEKKVLKNIRELTDKTVIIVSHRKAVLEVCDRCVVLEDKHFE